MRRRGPGSVVILGTQLAAAEAEEARVRAAHPNLVSPLGRRYDFWAGETDLARLCPSPVDDDVRSLVHRFVGLDEAERARLRTSLTIDDLYTVLQFCRRTAVASLRDDDPDLARDALRSLTLVDIERVDWRDVPGALELTAYAVLATAGDLPVELARVRSMATGELVAMIERLDGREAEATLRSAGYSQVTTAHGLGLIDGWGGGRRAGALGPVLVGIADAVDGDDYKTSSLTLGGRLPLVWFADANQERVGAIVGARPALGTVDARRRPAPGAHAQQFTVFVLDIGASERAAELVGLVGDGGRVPHAWLSVAHVGIFVLVVARSFEQGVDGVETNAALERFRRPFDLVLQGG